MDTILIVYLSGYIVSFVLGIYITFLDSENYEDILKGFGYTFIWSFLSWIFVLIYICVFSSKSIDEFLQKKLPWKK